jgi:hypothetical protein
MLKKIGIMFQKSKMKYVLDVKAKNSITLPGNTISIDMLEKYVSESLKSGSISMEDFKKNIISCYCS